MNIKSPSFLNIFLTLISDSSAPPFKDPRPQCLFTYRMSRIRPLAPRMKKWGHLRTH